MKKKVWIPEICYDESDDETAPESKLPLIHVPDGEVMPPFLLIWEVRNTGTFEPDSKGKEIPVVEWELRQYAQMDVLKKGLSPEDYDKVRVALGLKPMAEAVKLGQAITERVRSNVAQKEDELKAKKSNEN
jgi:hypothetical protein